MRLLRLGLADDLARIFVVPEGDELGVPQMVSSRPFEEVDPGDRFRSKPDALFHLVGSQALPPAASLLLGKFAKGHFVVERSLIFAKTSLRVAGMKPARTRAA